MARDRNIPVEIRNTQAGPELDTVRAGHGRLSANDKVLYFSSTFYSLALPFTIQEDQGSSMGPGGPQQVLRGGWAAHLTGINPVLEIWVGLAGIWLVPSNLQVALDRSGP